MKRSVFGLGLGLLLAAGMAGTSAAAPMSQEEAHAIGVDAYLYFYPAGHHGPDAEAAHQPGTDPWRHRRPDERFANVGAFPTRRHEGRGPAELRYALFERLARSDQGAGGRLGAGHRRPLLSPADARHVDRRVRFAGLAHDGNGSGQLPRQAAGWRAWEAGRFPRAVTQHRRRRRPMCGSSAAPRPTGPPTTTPCTRSRPATRSRRCRNGARSRAPPEVKIDPSIDMKTPPKRRSTPCRPRSSSPMRPSCSSCIRRTSPTSRSSRG